jgi:hypothetical protein
MSRIFQLYFKKISFPSNFFEINRVNYIFIKNININFFPTKKKQFKKNISFVLFNIANKTIYINI